MEIRLCPCNDVNRRQTMRNKRTEVSEKGNAQLFRNYIPDIVPFMQENEPNESSNRIITNKTANNSIYEETKLQETVGKYYYKVF